MTNWQELEKKYFLQTIKRFPITIVRGQGCRVWDETGKEYLDFLGGWAALSLGHCHPVMVEAIRRQAGELMHVTNQVYTIPQLQLAQLLIEHSCLDKLFFCNSGAEAVEGSVKLARRYGHQRLKGAYEVITANNSFHGRTMFMTAATGQARFHEPYQPIPAGFVHVPYNDVAAIKAATTEKTCAVMLEVVQGEGGVNIPASGYLKEVRAWCDQRGLLLILDEVQTGMGRLGSLWGYELFGVEPDIMALAKGMGGGFPVGVFLAKERAAVFEPGHHGSTYGGNALACATAYAVSKHIIDNRLPDHAREMGAYLKAGMEKLAAQHSVVKEVRGMGLLLAMEFHEELTPRLVTACLEEGLMVNPLKPTAIRLMPPLIVKREELKEGLARLERAFKKVLAPSR